MDLITKYPLGDDIAVILLVLAVLGAAAIAAGIVLPHRLAERQDDTGVDERLGARLGAVFGSAGSVLLWVGVPTVALMYLVPGTPGDKLLRSAMLLAGLVLGPVAAWRSLMILVAARGITVAERARALTRVGSLLALSALGIAVVPIAAVIWFLREAAGLPLLAMACGTAIAALTLRLVSAPVDALGAGAHMLAGVLEREDHEDDETTLGAPLELTARLFRRGAGVGADIVAVVTALVAAGVLVGLPVLAAEAILVVLLGLGIALLAAAVTLVIPHTGRPGQERGAFTLGSWISAGLAGAAVVALTVLWLPTQYVSLRFAQVGQGMLTDPALVGPQPVPRSELAEQTVKASEDMSQWLTATDDSRAASVFLDFITLHTVSPNAVAGGALAVGVLAAIAIVALVAPLGRPHGASVRRSARTSRTGGALGASAAAGSAALSAAGVLAVIAALLTVLSVLSGGVPELAATLLVHAGLGALVVVAGLAPSLAAPTIVDRPGTEPALRETVASAAAAPRAVLTAAAAMAGLALLAPIVTTIQLSQRAASVWEDRALHALTPMALPVLAGFTIGLIGVLLLAASLLEGARRAGALAVVEARTARLAGRDALDLSDAFAGLRRSIMTPLLVAVLLPVATGFGAGPAAIPAMIAGCAVGAVGLGLWARGTAEVSDGALAEVSAGRFGGPGSWAHTGAVSTAVLAGVQRASVGAVAVPLVLTVATVGALVTPAATILVWNGDVDPVLRWGIAVLAIIIAGAAWSITATAPEVDLEDGQESRSRPLFARESEEQHSSLGAILGDDDDEDSEESTHGKR